MYEDRLRVAPITVLRWIAYADSRAPIWVGARAIRAYWNELGGARPDYAGKYRDSTMYLHPADLTPEALDVGVLRVLDALEHRATARTRKEQGAAYRLISREMSKIRHQRNARVSTVFQLAYASGAGCRTSPYFDALSSFTDRILHYVDASVRGGDRTRFELNRTFLETRWPLTEPTPRALRGSEPKVQVAWDAVLEAGAPVSGQISMNQLISAFGMAQLLDLRWTTQLGRAVAERLVLINQLERLIGRL